MNLVFLYGPPAAGKLSISKELTKLTGYKLYDNHAIISPLGQLFSYTDPELNKYRVPLGERIRIDVFGTAAKAGVNFIATSGRGGEKDFIFFRQLKEVTEKNRGQMLFAQIIPPKNILMERVGSPSRIGIKVDNKDRLEDILNHNPGLYEKFPDVEHISIDNSGISPSDAAGLIADYYHLVQ